MRYRRDPESEEQRRVTKLYRTVGGEVWSTSQPFRAALRPGIPDLIVFFRGRGVMLFHETKSARGKQSLEQRRFQRAATDCGLRYVLGGETEAREALIRLGMLARYIGSA